LPFTYLTKLTTIATKTVENDYGSSGTSRINAHPHLQGIVSSKRKKVKKK
jgi:hypothetical protein